MPQMQKVCSMAACWLLLGACQYADDDPKPPDAPPPNAVAVRVYPDQAEIPVDVGATLIIGAQAVDAQGVPVNGVSVFFGRSEPALFTFEAPESDGAQVLEVQTASGLLAGVRVEGLAIAKLAIGETSGTDSLFIGLTGPAALADGGIDPKALRRVKLVVAAGAPEGGTDAN